MKKSKIMEINSNLQSFFEKNNLHLVGNGFPVPLLRIRQQFQHSGNILPPGGETPPLQQYSIDSAINRNLQYLAFTY
jgi:hypothetical protein